MPIVNVTEVELHAQQMWTVAANINHIVRYTNREVM